jgi:sterol 24-C-methyltransferase
MAYQKLETEDKARDAAFNKAMHGTSAASTGGFAAMMGKNSEARKAATDEYFKHWDNKIAKDETASDREVSTFTFLLI